MDHRAFQQAATHQIQQWLGVFAALDDPAGQGFAGGCRCHVGSAPSRSGAAAGIFKRAMAVSVPAHMSIGSVASQMVSMRITATVLEEKLA
jgi:hypothetical protein